MNFGESIDLLNKMKVISAEPPPEKGEFYIREYLYRDKYGESLALLKSITKAYKLKTKYSEKAVIEPTKPSEDKKLPKQAKVPKNVEVKETVSKKEKSIIPIKESIEKNQKQVEEAIKKPVKEKTPNVEELFEGPESNAEKIVPTKPKDIKAELNEELTVEQPSNVNMDEEAIGFKKEEVKDVKPLLGLDIPTASEAEKLAEERIKSLEKSAEPMSKDEISKRIISLTQKLLKERNSEEARAIKAEIAKLREMRKGNTSNANNEEELKKIMVDDMKHAIEEIIAAYHIYDGLEDKGKVSEELHKAVDAYVKYLKKLHEGYRKASGLNIKIDYSDLINLPVNLGAVESGVIPGSTLPEKLEESYKEAQNEKINTDITENVEKEKIEKEERVKKVSIDNPPLQQNNSIQQEAVQPAVKEETVKKEPSKVEKLKAKLADMREAQLLHELGARDKKSFAAYIRGEIDKKEAINRAKRLIAEEEGLSDEEIEEVLEK